jgi:hypothetical protein
MTELFFNLMHSNFVNKLTKIDSTFGAILRKKGSVKSLHKKPYPLNQDFPALTSVN